jgi:hypothetical protein
MVIYNGYCRPLKNKVDFEVLEVNPIETSRGVKWQIKGEYETYKISVFAKKEVALEIKEKLENIDFFEPLQEVSTVASKIHEIPLSQDIEEDSISFDAEEIIIYDSEELSPFPLSAEEEEEETENPTWKTLRTIRDFEASLLWFFTSPLHEDNEEQSADTSFPLVVYDWNADSEHTPITDITYSDEFDIIYLIGEVLEEGSEWDEVVNKSITIKQAYDKIKNILMTVAPEEIRGFKVKYGERVYDPETFEPQAKWEGSEDGYGLLIYPPDVGEDYSDFNLCNGLQVENIKHTYDNNPDANVYMFLVDTDDCDDVAESCAEWRTGNPISKDLHLITSFDNQHGEDDYGLLIYNLRLEKQTQGSFDTARPTSSVRDLYELFAEGANGFINIVGMPYNETYNELIEDEELREDVCDLAMGGQWSEGALVIGIERQDLDEALAGPIDYSTLKVVELKELLEDRGLTKSGKKADLIARLEEDDCPEELIDFDEAIDDDEALTYNELNEFVDEAIENEQGDELAFVDTQFMDMDGDIGITTSVLIDKDDAELTVVPETALQMEHYENFGECDGCEEYISTDEDEVAWNQVWQNCIECDVCEMTYCADCWTDDECPGCRGDFDAEDLEEAEVEIEEEGGQVSISYEKEAETKPSFASESPFMTDIGFITYNSEEGSNQIGVDDEDVIPMIFDKHIPPEVWGSLKDSTQKEYIETKDESLLSCPQCGMSKSELRANGGNCSTTDPMDESYVAKRSCPYGKHFAPMHWISKDNKNITEATKTAMNNVYFNDNIPIKVLAAEEETFNAPNMNTNFDEPQTMLVSKADYYDSIHLLPNTITAAETIDGLNMKLGFFKSESGLLDSIYSDTLFSEEGLSTPFSAEPAPLPELWAEDLTNFEAPPLTKINLSAEDYASENDAQIMGKYDYYRSIMDMGDDAEVIDMGDSVAIIDKDIVGPTKEINIMDCVGCERTFKRANELDKKGLCIDCSEESIEHSELQRYKGGGDNIYSEMDDLTKGEIELMENRERDSIVEEEGEEDEGEGEWLDEEDDEGYDISDEAYDDESLEEWEAHSIPRDTTYPIGSLTYNEANYGNNKSTKLKWIVGALGVGSLAAILAPETISSLFKRK